MSLSKSRFVAGWQCEKLLWWTAHEPDAVELQPDKVLKDLFGQGRQVGELARAQFEGGVLIDLPHDACDERIAATQAAIESSAPAGGGRSSRRVSGPAGFSSRWTCWLATKPAGP